MAVEQAGQVGRKRKKIWLIRQNGERSMNQAVSSCRHSRFESECDSNAFRYRLLLLTQVLTATSLGNMHHCRRFCGKQVLRIHHCCVSLVCLGGERAAPCLLVSIQHLKEAPAVWPTNRHAASGRFGAFLGPGLLQLDLHQAPLGSWRSFCRKPRASEDQNAEGRWFSQGGLGSKDAFL